MPELTGWENFYVIVGSSASALIGWQFVVITLIAEIPIARDVERGSGAFATPSIVHFGAVLLLSAVVSAPRHGIAAAILWGVLSLVGMVYVIIVARRVRVQTADSRQFEDRLFHATQEARFFARTKPVRFGPSTRLVAASGDILAGRRPRC